MLTILLTLLVVIGVVVLGFLLWLGYFNSMEVESVMIGGTKFMYVEIQKKYQRLGSDFQKLSRETKSTF